MGGDANAAVRRVIAALGDDSEHALEVLGIEVSGADLTSFLLDVMQRRAGRLTTADVMRRARTDPFVEPGAVDARALHRVIATIVGAVPDPFEFVELSPVVPLGTHSTVATVHQHKVFSTVRNAEVAADPTNALALLAALRGSGAITIRLAAVQRILRAQPFGEQGQQHFSVLAMVTSGRDRGHLAFETDALIEQLHALRCAIGTVTNAPVEIRLTDLSRGSSTSVIHAAIESIATHPDTTVTIDPSRTSGRGYYRDLCFKIIVSSASGAVEIGDGGFTGWMAQLRNDWKARLLTSGLGLDRLVTVAAAHPAP